MRGCERGGAVSCSNIQWLVVIGDLYLELLIVVEEEDLGVQLEDAILSHLRSWMGEGGRGT